jgi:hypothetical protein
MKFYRCTQFDNNNGQYFGVTCVVNFPEVFRTSKGKGKAIPLQTWAGLEGSRRMRLPDKYRSLFTRKFVP